jgi:hypothetical protein
MSDPIPRSDTDFTTFANTFVNYVAAHAVALGVAPATATALTDNLLLWTDSFAAHQTAQTNALAARATKDTSRATLEGLIRPTAQVIQTNPAVSDEQRVSAGLPIRDATRTRVAVPTSRPVGQVDTSQRLQHSISWRDESAPNSKAKPAGVRGAEIWLYVGAAPPSDPALAHFVALDTASPYVLEHDAADAGKLAHYLLRWVNTRSEPGPWSETVSATITG